MTVEATTTERAPTRAEEPAAGSGEVLVYNRDPELRIFLDRALYLGTLAVARVSDTDEAAAALGSGRFSLLVVGIDSPAAMEFLGRAVVEWPAVKTVAIARTATPELVCEVMRQGVADFLFGSMNVRNVVPRLLTLLGRDEELETSGDADVGGARAAGDDSRTSEDDYPIITESKRMHRLLEIAETVAPTQSTVLIQGESGTGKELIAKRIHLESKRSRKPFVEVNCGALPENLLESQLFGHEKGSFTGASQRQIGLFEVADHGTIFLDEVGEMSLDMQVKLLRVLQFKEFRRVGGSHVVKVDVRVIAATNKDLAEEVEEGRFRADLFYRLNVIRLEVPPLRERPEDVPALVREFGARLAADRELPQREFSEDAVAQLQKYRWTGNVRELENAVERLILLARGMCIEAGDVEEHLGGAAQTLVDSPFAPTLTLDEVKKLHIANVLRLNEGNKMKTARMLKINVKTLYNLIKSLGIPVP